MKYLLMIYLDEASLGESEREQCYAESTRLAHELAAEGRYLGAAPLHPVAAATTVRVREGRRRITDGPFAETREQFGGFFLIDAPDLDRAIDAAARIPMARKGCVEIRPVVEIGGLPEPVVEGEFVMTREFDAPRDLVWRAFTERGLIERWWGPKGFELGVERFEPRPGGVFHYSMRMPDGSWMWGRFVYREFAAPERMVFVSAFTDREGGVVRHPLSPAWPLETLNTVTLAESGGRTRMTWRAVPLHASEEERRTFAGFRDNLRAGLGGTLDQLAAQLRTQGAAA